MATMLSSDSRRKYSWWWDSHISPKNSKWLQENLTDMDAKVKAMIKLIEEDADSFARRAEMYYKKRPELIKLVEEFYRAYRALAERYDHATGELRQAQKTMAEVFPNQVPFVLADESPLGLAHGTEPHTPEKWGDFRKDALQLSTPDLNSVPKNGSYSAISEEKMRKGLKRDMEEKEEGVDSEVCQLSNNQITKGEIISASKTAHNAEIEMQNLKKALTDMQAEKEAVLSRYQQSLEKLSVLEGKLVCAEKDSSRLNEQAINAKAEHFALKETIIKLEADRDAAYDKNKQCLERISNLEVEVSRAQADAKGFDERTIKAEVETQYLKNELFRLYSEKEAGLLQYKQCLEKISDLERKVYVAEENARRLNQQAERVEVEVEKLKVSLAEVTAQKEATALMYKLCLDKISELESKLSCSQDDIRRLNREISTGATKLRTAEDKCNLLEMSNQNLRLEADNLVKKIALKDKELSEKHEELEKLQVSVQNECSRYSQLEDTLHKLQNLHSQSQEEQRTLALELKNGLKLVKDLEICKHGLEEEVRQIKDENRSLNELNSSSTMSIQDLQQEILELTRIKEGLEENVGVQLSQSNNLQQEIVCLKEEINSLNISYGELIKQVEMVGLDPKCFGSSVKNLQEENSRLREIFEKERDENEIIFKKLAKMEELTEKKAKELNESCHDLNGENSSLVAEKAVLLFQLRIITENMQKLLKENVALENSLRTANAELEGWRVKSKSLEELCLLLGNEKANLLTERSALAEKLEIVEQRLSNLEKKFTDFEDKYTGMEKDKASAHVQLGDLTAAFGVEIQDRVSLTLRTESRLATLENRINHLHEESKKEFREELEKAVISQFEVFVLQNFVEDVEDRNYSLLMECQKHIEASKLTDKLILELENEILEQQVEEELLLVEIERLRFGISQVLKSLGIGQDSGSKGETEDEQISVQRILEYVANMKHSLSKYADDKEQLFVENLVLLTLLGQLRLEGMEVCLEKNKLDQGFRSMSTQLSTVQSEKHKLLEMNRQLRSEVSLGKDHMDMLIAEVETLSVKQAAIQSAYLELKDEFSQTLEENRSLSKRVLNLKEEKCFVEEENNTILGEMLTFGNLSTVLRSFRTENAATLKLLSEDLHKLHGVNNELVKEISTLNEKMRDHESEHLRMKDLVGKLEIELSELKDLDFIMKQEISKLCGTVDELKMETEKSEVRENLEVQIAKLSDDNINQKKEIQYLLEVKGNLESELCIVNEEIEDRRIKEETLNLELQEKQHEFELWDAEAAAFYFDLQVSTIREVLLEEKVHELGGVCESLQDGSASKTQEIEQMKEIINIKESEIVGLKGQLLAYAPAIVSLKENIESLEQCTLVQANLGVDDYETPKDVEAKVYSPAKNRREPVEDRSSPVPDGISDLQKLQSRIKAVEKVVLEKNRLKKKERSNTTVKLEEVMGEFENLKSKCMPVRVKGKGHRDEPRHGDNLKLRKTKPELPDVKTGVVMKDIPLDHVSSCSSYGRSRSRSSRADDQLLVLWETGDDNRSIGQNFIEFQKKAEQKRENPSSELEIENALSVDKLQVSTSISSPSRGGKKKKILERLFSDGQKLANIQTTVKDLRTKLETNKKGKKSKNVDLETVKEQLQEAEETAVQLLDQNVQLTRKIEEFHGSEEASSVRKKIISEQARKGSEKIGRLQLEIQKIQFMLLKLEDEKKNKGKTRLSRTKSRTTVILRDFIYGGKRNSVKQRKKGRFCGCFKPSSSSPSSGEGTL